MKKARPLDALRISGFKSLKKVDKLDFGLLTVVIGANGAGKSNLVSLFRLLSDLVEGRLQYAVGKGGGPEAFLHFGSKVTPRISAFFQFDKNGYSFKLEPNATNQLIFTEEEVHFDGVYWKASTSGRSLGAGHLESKLKESFDADQKRSGSGVASYVYPSVRSWTVYHFHDTSDSALVKARGSLRDSSRLTRDAANLAAVLYDLRINRRGVYETIRNTVRLVVPYFDDFDIEPLLDNNEQTELRWRQVNSGYSFHASQLSDGTLRFICLVTALLQPFPPSTLIIDEPELGLHPYALTVLGSLVKQAATRTQVIICTQSTTLLSEFSPEDVVVAENKDGASQFSRLAAEQLVHWLEDYTLGEVWQKNLFGGGPGR